MYAAFSRIAETISRALAYAGGLLLLAVTILTCISIIGRAFVPLDIGIGPIRGMFDITEIAMAAAIFAFLPLAQFNDAHAKVDLLANTLPPRVNAALELLFNALMAGVAVFGTWRLYAGMQDMIRYGDTTYIAQIPVWQGYAAGLVGASGFVIVSLFCVLRSARRACGADL